MALIVRPAPPLLLTSEALLAWAEIPTAIISDEMNRFATSAGLRPVGEVRPFAGPALTVQVKAGDNAALHYAVAGAAKGTVLVCDAAGHTGTAVWGGILHHAARQRGIVAVIIDGAVRDVADLRASEVPVYARGVTPGGPHKGWGGVINGVVQVGGCAVSAGDLVVGDDDGIGIIPQAFAGELLPLCRARLAKEQQTMQAISEGRTTLELLNLPPATDFVGR